MGTAFSFSSLLLHSRLKQSGVKCSEQMLLYLVGLKFFLFTAASHFLHRSGLVKGNLTTRATLSVSQKRLLRQPGAQRRTPTRHARPAPRRPSHRRRSQPRASPPPSATLRQEAAHSLPWPRPGAAPRPAPPPALTCGRRWASLCRIGSGSGRRNTTAPSRQPRGRRRSAARGGTPGCRSLTVGLPSSPLPPANDPPRGTATGRGLSQLQDGGTSFSATLAVLRRAARAHWWVLSRGAELHEADPPIRAALELVLAPRSGTTSGAAAVWRQSAPRAGGVRIVGMGDPSSSVACALTINQRVGLQKVNVSCAPSHPCPVLLH